MDSFATKRLQALEACEKVINGIEDGVIPTSSSLLLCKKVARLVNDIQGQEWLTYEYGGYPQSDNGHIITSAWNIAVQHGRSYINQNDKKRYVFTDLAAELEESIASMTTKICSWKNPTIKAAWLSCSIRMLLVTSAFQNWRLEVETPAFRVFLLHSICIIAIRTLKSVCIITS